ncbi:hypothetical protein M5K25_026472 [Dendrobium thyrsiflorum]|uniref:Uncharacterized protein n=1 Tax=Dendrobium thyrsiflorum TaxID=117978 RepID=A0ABD0TXD9_DENTH
MVLDLSPTCLEIEEERESKVEKMSKKKGIDFNCPSTSNPHHVCADFCLEKMSEKLQDVGKEPEVLEYPVQNKEMMKIQRKGATPTSLKAVKSFNSCAGNFFSTNPRAERTKRIWVITERSDVHPDCKNAANPYHKCAKYCFKNIPNGDQPGQVLKLNNLEGEKIFSCSGRISLQSQCMYASNLQDECTDFCIKNGPDSNTREGAMTIAKEDKEVVPKPQREMNSNCENVSNPYVEYCFKNAPEKDQLVLAATKSKEENKIDLYRERLVNPECQFTSNPYHTCAEYCFQKAPEKERRGHVMTIRSIKKILSIREKTNVHPQCKFASNPYHECDADCFQNELAQNKARGVIMKPNKETKAVFPGENGVNPKCQFASNPYHVCAEYCFQNFPEGYPDKNQPVKSIPVTTKEKNRNSPSEKRDHPIMEKSTANLEFVEASKPIYNNVESSVAIIFPDQILKNSEDSNLVEESNPDSDYTDFSEGITMEVVAKDLMRVERRAFDTKNGQRNDNLKCNDSSNLAKVKSNSLQSSLPTSVLFFLGFLFALFKWTQVIHSVVMSSERKSSGRLMHKRPVNSK